MDLETSDLTLYRRFTPVIDGDHEEVAGCARSLTEGLVSDVEQARALFEWVRDAIPHSHDINVDVVTCSASEVLAARTGICYAKSHLFAALCRSRGIPAGFCYQVYIAEKETGRTAVHALNAVYLASLDRWIRLDPRGNTGDIDAQFDLVTERLAFPVDPAKGELFIYGQVFSDPAPEVVQALRRHQKRSDLWRNLPECLADESLSDRDRALHAALPNRGSLPKRS